MQGHLTSIKLAMAELAELSLDDFKMVKAIYLAKKLGEDTAMFEQSVEHLGDLPEQVARAGLIIDSSGISDDEARAYVHDMLLEMKATDMVPNDAYTTRRSPNSSIGSDASLPSLHCGSETTSGRNGSDVNIEDAMKNQNSITVKEESLPDFGDEPQPTPVEVMVARAMAVDNAGIRRPALELPAAKRPRLAAQAVAHDNEAQGWAGKP